MHNQKKKKKKFAHLKISLLYFDIYTKELNKKTNSIPINFRIALYKT